jgi:hypothetical protein
MWTEVCDLLPVVVSFSFLYIAVLGNMYCFANRFQRPVKARRRRFQ